jgi:hypothetical protein
MSSFVLLFYLRISWREMVEDPDMLPSLKVGEADHAHQVACIGLHPSRVEQDRHWLGS